MLVIFDKGTPRTLARFLIDHPTVTETRTRGWAESENGELLSQAEAAGFEVLVTTDKNLGYQQNLSGRKIAIVVLGQERWTLIKPHIAKIVAAVNAGTAGSFVEVGNPERISMRGGLPLPPHPRAGIPPRFVGTSSIAQFEGAGICEEWFP